MGALASYYNTMRATLFGARTSSQPCAKRELAAQASSRALRTSDNGSVIPPLGRTVSVNVVAWCVGLELK